MESEVSPEKSLEKNTQATDFKEIISQEEKKLSSLLSKNELKVIEADCGRAEKLTKF